MTARKKPEDSGSDQVSDPASGWEVPASAPRGKGLSLPQAMARARAALPDITAQPLDGIASSERDGSGWRIVAEVIEAPARMGDNDLLAAFELTLDGSGELTGFRRLRRYHREDRE